MTTQTVQSKMSACRKAWDENSVLQFQYQQYFDKIMDMIPQRADYIVEIGGGIGNFKAAYPNLCSTDLVESPYIDAAVDALEMPFPDKSLDAVVMVDVLHHLPMLHGSIREIHRCLKPGGRWVFVDVYSSLISWWVLKLLHPEPIQFTEAIWDQSKSLSSDDPWDSNQAVATELFWNDPERFHEMHPGWKLITKEAFDWCWPLGGGFSYPPFIPRFMKSALTPLSQLTLPNRLAAFRSFVALEKL